MAKPPGIVCFEGAWDQRLDSIETVEPALRCLEAFGAARIVHKNVGTYVDLEHYINKWLGRTGRGMPTFTVCMLAFHGTAGALHVGDDDYTLDELEELIDGRAVGRVIYLGGCSILSLPDDVLTGFCRRTGAKGIVGYTKQVDFIETSAFEIVLLYHVLSSTNFKSLYTRLRSQHPKWTKTLGLRMAHKTWASDKVIH